MLKFFTFSIWLIVISISLPMSVFAQAKNTPKLPELTITPKEQNWKLRCDSKELKTFKYSSLPFPNEAAVTLNDTPKRDTPFEVTAKKTQSNPDKYYPRGYFYATIGTKSTDSQYASINTTTPKTDRIMLYVEGTENYREAMEEGIKNYSQVAYSKDIKVNMHIGQATTHARDVGNFANSIIKGDVIIFCVQDSLRNTNTTTQKQADGLLLFRTSAHHIVRLYEHFKMQAGGNRSGVDIEKTKALLWFEGKESIYIDHTEQINPKEKDPYFIEQFDNSKKITWEEIVKEMQDAKTVVKVWEAEPSKKTKK